MKTAHSSEELLKETRNRFERKVRSICEHFAHGVDVNQSFACNVLRSNYFEILPQLFELAVDLFRKKEALETILSPLWHEN